MATEETKENLKKINKPFFFIGLFLIAGIIIRYYLYIDTRLLYFFCLVFLILSIVFVDKRFFYFLFVILCIFVGALRYDVASVVTDDNISNIIKSQKDIAIIGYVAEAPVFSTDRWGRERCSFNFKVSQLLNKSHLEDAFGQVKVYSVNPLNKHLEYGHAHVLEGDFKQIISLESEMSKSYQAYLKSRHIDGFFYINKGDVVLKLDKKPRINILYSWSMSLRKKLISRYKQLLPEPYSGLLGALILGERTEINKNIFDYFISSGSVHVLAISGLHVGIIVLFLIFIVKLFGFSRTQASIICIVFLVFYCFLSGARVSVIRASIMASIILGGWVIKRDSDIYNSLGLAALLILVFNPYYLFDIGFQLSFVSVLSIVYLYPKMNTWSKILFKHAQDKKINNNVVKYALDAIYVSLAASIAVAPLSLYYFQQVSTIGVLTNLIMLPILSLVLMLAIVVSLFSFISMPIAKIFAETLWFFLTLMIKAAQGFGSFHFSLVKFHNFKISYVLWCYLLLVFVVHIDILFIKIKERLLKSAIE